MNLFIIGNGFDLAHNMKTRYSDFRKYLVEEYPNMKTSYLSIENVLTSSDGGYYIDNTNVASILCYLIDCIEGEEWKDFENTLGEINLLECFDDLEEMYDRHGDRDLWLEAYNVEDRTEDLRIIIPKFKELFSDWVNTIEAANTPLQDFYDIINPLEDLFISFNYTHTLEDLYGCRNVVHLHGQKGGEIIIGHGGNYDYTSDNPKIPNGCFDYLQEIYDSLKKNTTEVIIKNKDVLDSITNCSRVYSYGFSYSDADLPYIELFCSLINNPSVLWSFNSYDKDKNGDRRKIVKRMGFIGSFDADF